ncbi:hypothetical protein AAG570_014134 [Ranatra chinensis]|uniref:Uncharacterized protein n=1 Tax=Ranatra chinensis TaxID=642074 RepID=A0ABD0XUH5_9HEMI
MLFLDSCRPGVKVYAGSAHNSGHPPPQHLPSVNGRLLSDLWVPEHVAPPCKPVCGCPFRAEDGSIGYRSVSTCRPLYTTLWVLSPTGFVYGVGKEVLPAGCAEASAFRRSTHGEERLRNTRAWQLKFQLYWKCPNLPAGPGSYRTRLAVPRAGGDGVVSNYCGTVWLLMSTGPDLRRQRRLSALRATPLDPICLSPPLFMSMMKVKVLRCAWVRYALVLMVAAGLVAVHRYDLAGRSSAALSGEEEAAGAGPQDVRPLLRRLKARRSPPEPPRYLINDTRPSDTLTASRRDTVLQALACVLTGGGGSQRAAWAGGKVLTILLSFRTLTGPAGPPFGRIAGRIIRASVSKAHLVLPPKRWLPPVPQ